MPQLHALPIFTYTENSQLVPRRNRAIASLVVGSKLVVFIRYYYRYKAGVEYALRSAEINKMSPCQPVPVFSQTYCLQRLVILKIKSVYHSGYCRYCQFKKAAFAHTAYLFNFII